MATVETYERPAPLGVRRAWILGLAGGVCSMLTLCSAALLLGTGENWVRAALSLGRDLGLPELGPLGPIQIVTTFVVLMVCYLATDRWVHPGWLRRRYGRCQIGPDGLTFALVSTSWPGSPGEGVAEDLVVEISRGELSAVVSPHGVLVEPLVERSRRERWARPLLIPVSEERAFGLQQALLQRAEPGSEAQG